MKRIMKFENFEYESEDMQESTDVCKKCGCECDVCECDVCECGDDWKSVTEKKGTKTSYEKSGLKHPEKADLNKDKKISSYEKKRGSAVQKSVQKDKEEKGSGLSAAQKKLPPALQKAILARKKK
jgi:hypothetical protein